MTDLKGKRALVTGASRGIGREVSLGLARLGCHVVLHSRSKENTASIAEEVRAIGVEAWEVEGELADQTQVDRMLDEALRSGPIDVLYNNAAIGSKSSGNVWDIPAEEYRRLFEVNTISLIRICYRLAPPMLERGFGRIINVTSGVRDQPNLMPYALSKAAVDKFVYDFAATLEGTGVQMNVLDPGWLKTDLGGPNATSEVTSVLPGALVPALLDDGVSGRWFSAQNYVGMDLARAVDAARAKG
jgi:NAD(P)-dependent dehydrogenase (short-subunit alcohol dehydrogenase family)